MSYRIKRNIFAPKINDVMMENAHLIAWDRCNFRCEFCVQRSRNREQYHEYSETAFSFAVQTLLHSGNCFKFTGGEPTLNPMLERDMRIVKDAGGQVFLDTNGSRPGVLRRLLDGGLVDVLALSLKGLDRDEAARTAEITNTALCWDKVLESVALANDHPEVYSMLTVVLDDRMDAGERLEKIRDLLSGSPNVRLKINNLHKNTKTDQRGLNPHDPEVLGGIIADFVIKYPEYKGRVIYEPTQRAVTDYSQLRFY